MVRGALDSLVLVGLALLFLTSLAVATDKQLESGGEDVVGAAPPDHWAMIVSTSRFWHNYRHSTNALSFYNILKGRQYSDERIMLLLAENYACDPRNVEAASQWSEGNANPAGRGVASSRTLNLARCDGVQIDHVGYQVSVKTTLESLLGLYDPVTTPSVRRMNSGPNSNVLVYMTGHGGAGFLKFHDSEILSAEDVGMTVALMHTQQRYGRMLLFFETCNGGPMCSKINSPNVVCVTTSREGEDSLSHHHDQSLGVHVIDRFTYFVVEYFQTHPHRHKKDVTLFDMFQYFTLAKMRSHLYWPEEVTPMLKEWKVSDFFDGTSIVSGNNDSSKSRSTSNGEEQQQKLPPLIQQLTESELF